MPNPMTRRAAARHPLDHDPGALRRSRVAAGLSQQELAAKAHISGSHLSELERGVRNPSPAALARLAQALDCTTVDLMPAAPVSA